MSKPLLNQHGFLAGASRQVFLLAPCFPQGSSLHIAMLSCLLVPQWNCMPGWMSKSHPNCLEQPSATDPPLVSLLKFDHFLSLLNSVSCVPVPTSGLKTQTNTNAPHCCFAIQQGCKTPLANPTAAGVGKTILLVIWLVSSSEEEIRLSTHLQSQAQVQSEQGIWWREWMAPSEIILPHSVLWDLASVCYWMNNSYRMDIGGPLPLSPCSLGLPAGKSRG